MAIRSPPLDPIHSGSGSGFGLDLLAYLTLAWYSIILLLTLSGSLISFSNYRKQHPPPPFSNNPLPQTQSQSQSQTSTPTTSTSSSSTLPQSINHHHEHLDQPPVSHSIRPGSNTLNLLIPSVSILRPLSGIDPGLRLNIESAFLQQWPRDRFEVLCCVAHPADPAIQVVEQLIASHPTVNARLIIGPPPVHAGPNPKINNLIQAYRSAKADLLWILDSNTRVHPSTLAHAVALLSPPSAPSASRARPRTRIGLVHHVPAAMLAASPDGAPAAANCLGSLMEACYLNGPHARQYLALNSLGVASCLMGKSNLFYRSDLERATARRQRQRPPIHPRRPPDEQARLLATDNDNDNDNDIGIDDQPSSSPQSSQAPDAFHALELYAQFLGEDNMIGQTLWDDGIRHATTGDVAGNVLGPMSIADYVARRVRWIRARKYMSIVSTLLEPFTEPVLLGLLAMAALERLGLTGGYPKKLLLAVHLLAYLCIDYSVYRSLLRAPLLCSGPSPSGATGTRPIGAARFVVGWAAREALALAVWLVAMSSDRVVWRKGGRPLKVLRDGRVVEC